MLSIIVHLVFFTPFLLIILSELLVRRQRTPKGCRRIGLPARQSNIQNEYDKVYSRGQLEDDIDEDGQPFWRIKALFIYPIKSCAGIELDVADGVETGLVYDRQFCFAEHNITSRKDPAESNSPEWEFKTMRDRRYGLLALVRPEIWVPDPASPDYSSELEEVRSQGVLVVYYPRIIKGIWSLPVKVGMTLGLCAHEKSFRVPLHPPLDNVNGDNRHVYPSARVRIWKDSPHAFDYGKHIPQSLRDFLHSSALQSGSSAANYPPLSFFRADPADYRKIFRCAPRKSTLGFQPLTAFADAYPLHMLNLASVRDIAARCASAIPCLSVRRFRANIIIQGPDAYAEDSWKRIRVVNRDRGSRKSKHCLASADLSKKNEQEEQQQPVNRKEKEEKEEEEEEDAIEIYTSCRTVRCRLPNVDPDTGIRHPAEPDRTLKSFRRIDAGDPNNACLGMQLVPAVPRFTLHVGDKISVVETGEHFYIRMFAPREVVG
ncbi:hypothetical protein V8E54_005642 [Elaphomyces granulatus]